MDSETLVSAVIARRHPMPPLVMTDSERAFITWICNIDSQNNQPAEFYDDVVRRWLDAGVTGDHDLVRMDDMCVRVTFPLEGNRNLVTPAKYSFAKRCVDVANACMSTATLATAAAAPQGSAAPSFHSSAAFHDLASAIRGDGPSQAAGPSIDVQSRLERANLGGLSTRVTPDYNRMRTLPQAVERWDKDHQDLPSTAEFHKLFKVGDPISSWLPVSLPAQTTGHVPLAPVGASRTGKWPSRIAPWICSPSPTRSPTS